MRAYQSKVVTIHAVQITSETFDGAHPNDDHPQANEITYDPANRCVYIETLEGVMRGDMGDWIVRGLKGEYYPCKDEVFKLKYQELEMI